MATLADDTFGGENNSDRGKFSCKVKGFRLKCTLEQPLPNAPVRKIYFLLSGEVGFDDRGGKEAVRGKCSSKPGERKRGLSL